MTHIGMDIHKRYSTFCVLDPTGGIIERGKVDSSEEGWSALLKRWPAADLQVAVETGSLTWWLVDVARGLGIEPVVVDARQFKMVASSKKKTDRRDAFHLAEAIRTGIARLCAVSVPSARARQGRGLLQARATIVKQCTISRNAALGLLRSIGVSTSKRRFCSDVHWSAVIARPEVPAWMRTLLEAHRAVWKSAEKERASLDRSAELELQHWPEAKRLLDMPGFGPIVTLAVASAFDDPHRFKRQKQVASYGGIVPSVRDSGGRESHGSITRQGRSLLRLYLVQAAQSALRSKALSPNLRRWALRLLMRKGRGVAVVALARRLVMLAHRLLVTGEPYNPHYGIEVAA